MASAHTLLLPPPLNSDERFRVLGELSRRINDIDLSPLLVYLIDTVNASALPHLAEQLHLLGEGWQFAHNDAERRALLKRAIELHRYKGTRWAIEQVLQTLALSGQISEWFEYGGTPYTFKVNVELATRGINETTFNALVSLINEYKNVRSHLDLLALSLINRSATPVIAATTLGGESITVHPYTLTQLAQRSTVPCCGIGQWISEWTTVRPDISTQRFQHSAVPRCGVGQWSIETTTVYPASM